jgi:SAM-dependent methyltransferase
MMLGEYAAQASSGKGHYFHQDLLVAGFVNQCNPERHIDIGSRIDGFVAHIAAFRRIEVMDVRQLDDCGLGRYGDPLDPAGHVKGFNNIAGMLRPGGRLCVSFPIGRATEVHFNAHRVFHPRDVLGWVADLATLRLERFDYVDDRGLLHREVDLDHDPVDVEFGCGIYTFARQ